MKKIFVLFVAMISLLSCSQEGIEKSVVTEFPIQESLVAEPRSIPVPLLLPRYMGIWDNYLFVYKEREDSLFSVFRLPDLSYVGDAGSRGGGPDEFNMLDTRSFHASTNGTFVVLEAGSNLLKTVKFDGRRLKVLERRQVLEGGVANNGLYPLADSLYLTLGRLEGDSEYCLFNLKDKSVTEVGRYPDWAPEAEGANKPPLFVTYLKTCAVHPDGKRVAVFYSRFKHVRIYDGRMNLMHDVEVRVKPCHTRFDEPAPKQPGYYLGQPFATERYIYALSL